MSRGLLQWQILVPVAQVSLHNYRRVTYDPHLWQYGVPFSRETNVTVADDPSCAYEN